MCNQQRGLAELLTAVFTGYETPGFASSGSTSISLRPDDDNVPSEYADLMVNDVLVFVNNGVTPTGSETQYTIQSLSQYSGPGDAGFNVTFTPGLSSSAAFRSDVYRIETSGATGASLSISNGSSTVLTATPAGVDVTGALTVNGASAKFPTYGPVQFARNDNTTAGFDGSITLPSGMTSARIKMSVRPYNAHVNNFWMDVSNITNVTLEAGNNNFIRFFGTKFGNDTRITVYSTNSILDDISSTVTQFPPSTAQFGLLDGETPSMSNLQYSFPFGGHHTTWSADSSQSSNYLEIEATQTGTITFGGITNDISRYFVQYHYIT